MQYKVTKQYLRGGVTQFAEFNELNDAKLFIRAKLAEDAALNIKIIYRIDELGETILEFQPGSSEQAGDNQGGSSGKGSSATFRPSPLSTSLKPPGMPGHWQKDEDKGDKK